MVDTHLRPKLILFLPRLQLTAALMMAVVFPFSFGLFNVGIVILMVSFILKRILDKNFSLFDSSIDSMVLIFFVISCISVGTSAFPAMSLQGIHKLARYLLLFVAAREVFSKPRDLKFMIVALLTGVAIAGLDGVIQVVVGVEPLRGQSVSLGFHNLIRISSCFPNPNALAIYLSCLLPLIFSVARYAKLEKKRALIVYLLFFVAIFCMYLTYARSAFIALVLNVAFFSYMKKDKWILLGLLVLLGIGGFFLQSEVRDWVKTLSSLQDFVVDKGRYFHHHAALNMIAARPWFGMGLNTFDVNYAQYRLPGDSFTRWSAHEGYLQMASETGLMGLGAFLVLLLAIFFYCRKAYAKIKTPFTEACFLGFVGGFMAFLVSGFFESIFWQPRQANFFWFWTGLMCATAKLASLEKADGTMMQGDLKLAQPLGKRD